MYTPIKEDTRIWLYHKPRYLICTHFDPNGRVSVYDRLKDLGIKQHVVSAGRLDYLSEGLLIVTNNGEVARALEMPSNKIERSYKLRVFGRMFDEAKLLKIRKGFKMNGI